MRAVDVYGYNVADGAEHSRTYYLIPAHVVCVTTSDDGGGRAELHMADHLVIRTEHSVGEVFKKLRKANGKRYGSYVGVGIGCVCTFIVMTMVMGALFGG